ncbi:LOW QUALITY PROTEIN: uncharacterized protein [Argopecten irradians]|uniref:LOW QUALITY PROTEIN: uncharacterized protein n=1 Tax=Argopecten irradians TaxID=31199 RepID=UPI00371747CC
MPGQSTTKRGSSSKERMSNRDRHKTSPPASYPGLARQFNSSTDRSRDRHPRPSSATRSSRSASDQKSNALNHESNTSMDNTELSDLRNLIHLAGEVKKIDLLAALSTYKELMRKTKNDDQIASEDKYLESLAETTSGRSNRNEQELQDQLNALLDEKKNTEEENKRLERKCRELQQLQDQRNKVEDELKQYETALAKKEKELRKAKKEKEDAENEKSEALTRLSKEMGQKLTDNNPGIADLSDPNRALKLAEKYNELYDNEWTDAMEILGEIEKNEQINVQVLLETLKKCYNFCADLAEKQMESLGMALVHPTDDDKQKPAWDKPKKLNIPKSVIKQMKDCRKEMSTTTVNSIKLDQLTDKLGYIARRIPNFVSKCIEICWFMCVLDPPVVLGDEASAGTTFDTNIYKPYTHSGTVVSYNVWPPLLLHKKGDLLVKGIVQPVKVVKKKTAARMDVNGMKETKSTKDRPHHAITYSTDRLTENVEYGDAGYDPMVDAYGRHEPLTDAYGRHVPAYGRHEPVTEGYNQHEPATDAYDRRYRVTKPIKTYDQSTRIERLDRYGDTYSQRDPVTKTTVSRTDTLLKEHKPSSDYSRTTCHQQYLQGEGYTSHRLHIRDNVESRRANVDSYDHGILRPKTNYVQENVAHFSSNKLVYRNDVPFIELNGQLYDYQLYKRIFGKQDESYT